MKVLDFGIAKRYGHDAGAASGLKPETEFRTEEWLQALRDLGVEGTVICESPNLESDTVMLKKLYQAQKED